MILQLSSLITPICTWCLWSPVDSSPICTKSTPNSRISSIYIHQCLWSTEKRKTWLLDHLNLLMILRSNTWSLLMLSFVPSERLLLKPTPNPTSPPCECPSHESLFFDILCSILNTKSHQVIKFSSLILSQQSFN